MIEHIPNYALPLIASVTPISLIIITQISKLFTTHHPKLGKTTTICIGIKGVLTSAHIEVKNILFDKYKVKPEEKKGIARIEDLEDKEKEETIIAYSDLKKDPNVEIMAVATTLCPFTKLKKIEEVTADFFKECEFEKKEIIKKYKVLQQITNSKEKKYSSIVVKNNETEEIYTYSKGNPLRLLKKCTKVIINGKKIELTHQSLRKLRKRIDKMNKSGQKVIGYAIKPLPLKILEHYSEGFAEKEMTFIGAIGTRNPLNKNIKEKIKISKNAGIKNYILTKESEKKAVAIGSELEIINPQYFESITGEYLKELNDKKLEKLIRNKEKDLIFCELTQDDKLRILEFLRKEGEIIARTTSKQKNSYEQIVEGIEKGRKIEKNHRKFFDHAIICKISQTLLLLTAIALNAPIPLTVMLILALDIGINLLLELSLRAEPVKIDVMTEKYHPANTKSIKTLIFKGIISGIIISTAYFITLIRYGWSIGTSTEVSSIGQIKATTIAFTLIMIMQIINSITLRKKKQSSLSLKFFRNIYLTLSIIVAILLAYGIAIFKPGQQYLGLIDLSNLEWQIIFFLTIVILIIDETLKYIIRNKKNEIA